MANVSMRGGDMMTALQTKLRIVRSYLSAEQFDALVGGQLDVEAFLAQATVVAAEPQPKQKRRFSRMRSEEDSIVKEDSEFMN